MGELLVSGRVVVGIGIVPMGGTKAHVTMVQQYLYTSETQKRAQNEYWMNHHIIYIGYIIKSFP